MVRVFRPIPVESIKLLVFDLDGTLIDSAQDLCNSVNATLTQFGRPSLPDTTIAGYIGNGALLLVRRAFAADDGVEPDEETLAKGYAYFLGYYREHKLDYTYAYEGVLEALTALRTMHEHPEATPRAMAVLTNKPVRPAQAICEALGLSPYFLRIYGGNSFATKKPDPEGLLAIMREADARPEETVMIGDSQVDVQTARNARAWSIGCTFGLAPGSLEVVPPDILVDSPAGWTDALRHPQTTAEPR
jgi:phosphoglycolate phosphatase